MEATLLSRPNPASGQPVYVQLVGQLRRGLETGALRPGEMLPGVRPLAEALVVHPSAVARAYDELEQLRLAYPDTVAGTQGEDLVLKDGTRLAISDGRSDKSFEELLNSPDVDDMFAFAYPAGAAAAAPAGEGGGGAPDGEERDGIGARVAGHVERIGQKPGRLGDPARYPADDGHRVEEPADRKRARDPERVVGVVVGRQRPEPERVT